MDVYCKLAGHSSKNTDMHVNTNEISAQMVMVAHFVEIALFRKWFKVS